MSFHINSNSVNNLDMAYTDSRHWKIVHSKACPEYPYLRSSRAFQITTGGQCHSGKIMFLKGEGNPMA